MDITPSWLLQVGVDASTINPVNIGVLNNGTIFDQVEAFINVIGEEAGKGYEMLLHIFSPGLDKKLPGFMNATKNEDIVLIAQDSAGQNYLLGCEIRSANMYTYTGSIPLTEAAPGS
jgi:hypothetical protein